MTRRLGPVLSMIGDCSLCEKYERREEPGLFGGVRQAAYCKAFTPAKELSILRGTTPLSCPYLQENIVEWCTHKLVAKEQGK